MSLAFLLPHLHATPRADLNAIHDFLQKHESQRPNNDTCGSLPVHGRFGDAVSVTSSRT